MSSDAELPEYPQDPAAEFAGSAEGRPAREPRPPRPPKREVNGWVVLDKPIGLTSTRAVAQLKWLYRAKKAGHAGTLDPLASGCLPIAFGEATKTVPFVMDGRKIYRFTVAWGAETDTDDADGTVVDRSDVRPDAAAIEALLPAFTGEIMQVPPRYSALKIDGERAYDLAREGIVVEMQPRPVVIDRLELVDAQADTAVFEAACGKGTYVRSLARDIGRALGSRGHVVALRRTAVGPFDEADAVSLEHLQQSFDADPASLSRCLLPVEKGLTSLPQIDVGRGDAERLQRGQSVLLRGRDAPIIVGAVSVHASGRLVALADIEDGELHPRRVFGTGA